MGYLDDTIKFRVFDPLHIPKIKKSDCVFHYCVYLQRGVDNRVSSTAGWHFKCIKENIKIFSKLPPTKRDNFRMDLVISINGHLEEKEYIDYFKKIDGTVINKCIYITVFQRQNIGYQWGGFHDVWMRYKDIDCNWYVTMETDDYIAHDYWFDIAVDMMKEEEDEKIGFFGKYQKDHPIDPVNFVSPGIPPEVWRTGENKVNYDMQAHQTLHSSGGFYFCRKSFLQHMDKVFGCFTHSMGCNWRFDGVVLGEVVFSNKTRELGYDYSSRKFPFFVKDFSNNIVPRKRWSKNKLKKNLTEREGYGT